ncbi:LysR family transcriptional regulator [Candidatus Pantoea floridensis]|uniref:DNA-binding transcriptional regulator, LysR family n=1 Tax=Candidatus Pantoea floridensis TaxID=1938870 RepID=A0A286DNG8_9GAMM|nr:LysR family transcriptional regulator [Pantoea floridensis]PIF15149.1 DNA-binding transcriptional LysR family regulator [Enterobacteriaceae bacterium JKS000233]SOD60257.1 DNA-binding transcriptional regulator, LysR family [Pantoea floridensis]
MNTRLLNAFVMLAEKGNYAEAARALYISQPALTKQIHLLESIVNMPLFSRGRHGAILTVAGRRLLPQAEKVVRQTQLFMHHAGQVSKGIEGNIAVGFGLSSFYLAPRCIAEYRREYPGIEVSLTDQASFLQYDMLLNDELQLGFVRVPPPVALDYLPLFTDRLVLVAPATSSFSVADWLKKVPLLRLHTTRGRGLNAQIDRYLHDNALFTSSIQETDDIQTIVALVIAGTGVALLPYSVVHIAPPELVIIPLTGESLSWQVGIAWNANHEDVIRDNFIASIRKAMTINKEE